ncbi:MAG: type II secretion system protein [Armatimonadetes bacterium]|nr:type II secretion system protein [Armatimonadota bacterium]
MNQVFHGLSQRDERRRGFTLTELLVVIGITAVLMFLLFIPLSRAIDLAARGEARVDAQDTVRLAMRRIKRELQNAMIVYPPRDLQIWGFSQWTAQRNRPVPAPTAVPEPSLIRNGMVAFRSPKYRYYCVENDHYVTPVELGLLNPQGVDQEDEVALDSCPRHVGSNVELRPTQPLEPSDLVTAYFVALKDPNVRAPGNQPLYQNTVLFRNVSASLLNTYILWRVEFDPRNPIYGNFGNPDFFYDRRTVTNPLTGVTQSYSAWWTQTATKMITGEATDLVRWVETNSTGKYVPHVMVSLNPTPFEEDTAQPNRNAGEFNIVGSTLPADLPPADYETQYGNWVMPAPLPAVFTANGRAPIPDALRLSNTVTMGVIRGPRIQVFGYSVPRTAGQPSIFGLVFDSAGAAPRSRLVGFDPLTGRVALGLPRVRTRALDGQEQAEEGRFPGQMSELYRDQFSAPIELSTFTIHLADDPLTGAIEGDREVDINTNMPTALGSARARQLQIEASSTNREDFTAVVPGSDTLTHVDTAGPVLQTRRFRRAGWTGLGRLDQPIAQSDLQPDEYAIDYQTGVITLSDQRPGLWTTIGPAALGFTEHLLIGYEFQTNRASDVVKVSYSTQELAALNLGVVQYTRRRGEALPFEVSERVVIKNLQR